jgi:ketosteroid isomerase-like protein
MIEGRAGVEAFAGQMFAAGMRTLELQTVDILEGGDLVAEVGRFTMGFGPGASSAGKYITVYRRQPDGSLLIEADTFNGDAPAA